MQLTLAPVSQLVESGVWRFPAQQPVEGVLVFCRLWLRRELQLSKYAAMRSLSAEELDERMQRDEELCMRLCCRLAFGMFKRGETSCQTRPHEADEQATVVSAALGKYMSGLSSPLLDGENADCVACCPLRRSGDDTYSFVHKSLQDCFAALHMAHEIAQWQLQAPPLQPSQPRQPPATIGDKFLTDDVGVLRILAQLVDRRVWAYRRQGQATDTDAAMQPLGRGLWDLVYESRRLQPQQQTSVQLGM